MSSNKLPTDEDVSELLKISRVHNTDKCMTKWLRAVNESKHEKLFENIS
ncbi:45578_t:CDS:1, partial [Gigaspora margarita]